MVQLGLLSGSLSGDSANQAALDVIAAEAERLDDTVVHRIEGLAAVPAFMAEDVDSAPAPVAHLRQQIDRVDALIMAVPEYAAGLAGSTKNALDWLVGASTLYQKPVAVISAGTTGGQRTIEQLVHTLSWQGALTMATLGIEAPRPKMANGVITDPATVGRLVELLRRVTVAVRGSGADRRAALVEVVSGFDIDVERFGDIP